MRTYIRILIIVTATVALATVACNSDDDSPGDTSPPASTPSEAATDAATAAATEMAPETATSGSTSTPTEEATPEESRALPFGMEGLDGLACMGQWTNETFGSTGDFAATFHMDDGGGSVTLEIGGNALGAVGGTVDAPFSVEGDSTVFDVDLGFLGQAMFNFAGASPREAVLQAPPALGEGSEVMLTEFEFTGSALNVAVDIRFPDGSSAHSVLESTCG